MSGLTDSHAHLTSETLYDQVDLLVERARNADVKTMINICTDPLSLERGLLLSERYPWIHQVASTTPHDVEKEGESFFKIVAEQAKLGKLKAIGETGLDYFYEHSPKETQKKFFIRYLHLALEYQLPVVIHCREAFQDFFEILDAEYVVNGRHAPGVLHCFTGTILEAEEVLKRGWMLSLSGIVTFKKSLVIQEVAKFVPLSQLLIETDAPYLAPMPYRGKQNEPAFLKETASFIAFLKQISLNEVADQTSKNANVLFKIY